jgi:hypothetical protein
MVLRRTVGEGLLSCGEFSAAQNAERGYGELNCGVLLIDDYTFQG